MQTLNLYASFEGRVGRLLASNDNNDDGYDDYDYDYQWSCGKDMIERMNEWQYKLVELIHMEALTSYILTKL